MTLYVNGFQIQMKDSAGKMKDSVTVSGAPAVNTPLVIGFKGGHFLCEVANQAIFAAI
ncbi:hypothetical protein KFU94_36880 [Chloroflexi bacterium TSY]|nr:hypothetical protein [Chloroflexi bacterium TSY]